MSDMPRNIIARNKAGEYIAIPSVCSADPEVLSVSLQLASNLKRPLVIEATSNQVNQFGDYTGMDARKFMAFIDDLKSKHGIESNIVELGGDHLGPQVWKSETADMAMAEAHDLVSKYVRSGIKKIRLDRSEGYLDEPPPVDSDTAAERAADLAVSCLDEAPAQEEISFVIGTEVPSSGSVRLGDDGHIIPTTPKSAVKTLIADRATFAKKGIADSWPQVFGLVVQPGIEFGPDKIFTMSKGANSGLRDSISEYPEICLEAHSTDFQPPETLAKPAKMGFGFQKVVPALTFALRRALYALNHIVQKQTQSAVTLPQVVEAAMCENPEYWRSHFSENDISKWHFSYAHRIRYYLPLPAVKAAVTKLTLTFDNLKIYNHILEQNFFSDVLERSEGLAASRGHAIVRSEFQGVLLPYFLEDRNA